MRRTWLIIFACSACLASPLAHAQERPAPEPAAPSAPRSMSPIGKAMAQLLRQASLGSVADPRTNVASPSPSVSSTSSAGAGVVATPAPPPAPGSRQADEVAVQPPR